MAEKELSVQEKFVQDMLEKTKEKKETEAHKRAEADPKEVEDILKNIQEKIQKGNK